MTRQQYMDENYLCGDWRKYLIQDECGEAVLFASPINSAKARKIFRDYLSRDCKPSFEDIFSEYGELYKELVDSTGTDAEFASELILCIGWDDGFTINTFKGEITEW